MPKPRKTEKVEEPAGAYLPSPKQPAGIRYARRDEVLKTNEKLMKIHRRVLEKLAK